MRLLPCLALAAVLAAPLPAAAAPAADLSILSYNIHGLPWPIVHDRSRPLAAIGEALARMRAAGAQPHLVLLQEAFTARAKAIAATGGYPFAVRGPGRRGDLADSGLLILSDYPLLDARRMVYGRGACAGYDCLANKGALLVRVAVPGLAQPLAVIDTHLNARGASGVGNGRADHAYARQTAELRRFVADNVPSGSPAILGGDFNVGQAAPRKVAVVGVLAGGADAVRSALAGSGTLFDRDAAQGIATHNKDWLFARSGTGTRLRLLAVSVPFARGGLSDHAGYIARYAAEPSEVATAVHGAGLKARL